jgi:hypothetical protein
LILADRICQYCKKEFQYPSVLKRHLKLKNICSLALNKNCKKVDKQISPTSNRVSPTSNRVSPTSNRVSPTSNRVSPTSNRVSPTSDQVNIKNTVPIRLLLA